MANSSDAQYRAAQNHATSYADDHAKHLHRHLCLWLKEAAAICRGLSPNKGPAHGIP